MQRDKNTGPSGAGPGIERVSPGMNRVSPYFSGMEQGGVGNRAIWPSGDRVIGKSRAGKTGSLTDFGMMTCLEPAASPTTRRGQEQDGVEARRTLSGVERSDRNK